MDRCSVFERVFVEMVQRRLQEREDKMTLSEFARLVFPDKKSPYRQLRAIIGESSKTGRPQSVRLEEACRMALVLEQDFPSFCWDVWQAVKKGDVAKRREHTDPPPRR